MKFPLVSEPKLKAFKDKIGFDKVEDGPNPNVGVVADWDGIRELLPSEEKGWKCVADDVTDTADGLTRRQWILKRGAGTLSVHVSISSVGAAAARQALLTDATATMMAEIPYVRGPARLGQLAIRLPREPLTTVMWVFHNAYVKILGDDIDGSIEDEARAIQAFMERHVKQDLPRHLPPLGSPTLSRGTVKVGEEVEVGVRAAAGNKELRVIVEAPVEDLDAVRQTGASSIFVARRPGKVPVHVRLVHLKTLLKSRAQATVDIQVGSRP